MAAPEIIKRSQLAEYLNVGTTDTPVWERIGFGVESKSTDFSPEVEEMQYIHEDSPSSNVKSYAMTSEFDIKAAKGSPVFEYLDKLRIKRATYAAADTQALEVRLYEPIADETNVFAATMTNVAVAASSLGDAAEDPLTLSASVHGKGDPVEGKFDYQTKTFTANVA